MNKPFLKWPGGKAKISTLITKLFPEGKRLVEPFVGSGAIFLNSNFEEYFLADLNSDLINLYNILKKDHVKFIKECSSYFIPENNTEERFKEIRNQFNNTLDLFEKAIIFVYLNRHAFNGLCRYNSKGIFNAPFGNYEKPRFPLNELSSFIKKTKFADFKYLDFRETWDIIKKDDIIYADPPYVPLSDTASFTTYSSDGFSNRDQEDLAMLANRCKRPVIISNHDTKYTRELYKDAEEIHSIDVSRVISCKGDSRKPVKEILALFNFKRNERKTQKDLMELFGYE